MPLIRGVPLRRLVEPVVAYIVRLALLLGITACGIFALMFAVNLHRQLLTKVGEHYTTPSTECAAQCEPAK